MEIFFRGHLSEISHFLFFSSSLLMSIMDIILPYEFYEVNYIHEFHKFWHWQSHLISSVSQIIEAISMRLYAAIPLDYRKLTISHR